MIEAKYKSVKNRLLESILAGKWQVGEKFPSCRTLAETMEVSYITINKAIKELAEDNYLDITHGKGAFVRWRETGKFLCDKKVKILFPTTNHVHIELVESCFSEILGDTDWDIEFVRLNSIDELINTVKNPLHYSVIFGFSMSRYEDIRELCSLGGERLIVLNNQYDRFGISSSTVDGSQIMRLCIQEFKRNNRQNVALLCSNLAMVSEGAEAAVWQNLMLQNNSNHKEVQGMLWDLKLEPFSEIDKHTFGFLEAKYEQKLFDKIDAIITTDDLKAVLVNSFCASKGIKIPDDISLITINESPMLKMVYPKISSIDNNLEMQVKNAVNILEAKSSNSFNGVNLIFAEPELILRDSIINKV